MGCIFSLRSIFRRKEESVQAPKQYSWDNRQRVDPKDFTIENLKGETAGRLPGTVNGQQFIIQNCQDCNIYVFDHSATISVDDCINCRIFLGPIKTSVFVRDCTDCKLMIACQQFRTRDCKKLDTFLCCTTQPIIEASTGMKFGCFQYHYPELEEQFQRAGLSVYNNNWSNVHDFTPVPGEKNFSLLPADVVIDDYILLPGTEQFANMQISSTDRSRSVVPITLGPKRNPGGEPCLIVFFHDEDVLDRVKHFIQELRSKQTGCIMVQTKEVLMNPSDAQRVFTSDNYEKAVLHGPVIGVEYNGPDCCKVCHSALLTERDLTGLVFVSATGKEAASQVDNFYSFADMQMNL
ncbi:Protein XRP2 [Lamellibrachia satsuma]|nr:Protein XRP2 [Lamellibrachia satsuma]